MKKLLLIVCIFFYLYNLNSQVHVNGYTRKDGTYVKSHYRSNPDGNPYNNWSYPGNYNPYTGEIAGGSSSTYLRNYYKVYPNENTTSSTFKNYNYCLTGIDYVGLRNTKPKFTLLDNDDTKVGYLKYYENNFFFILDINDTLIGIIQMKRNGKKYKVYDTSGYLVSTNIKQVNWGNIGTLFLSGTIAAGLGILSLE